MHKIEFNRGNQKDTKDVTVSTNYNTFIVLHENDLRDGVKCLRGYSVDVIIIPRTFSLIANPEIEELLHLSLTPKIGRIKRY